MREGGYGKGEWEDGKRENEGWKGRDGMRECQWKDRIRWGEICEDEKEKE